MSETEKQTNETNDFNIYYLNFSKVYEMAMIISNQIVKSYQKETGASEEMSYSRRAGMDFSAGDGLLSSVKSSISSDYVNKSSTNSKVVESIEVKTTKSTLLRKVMAYCKTYDTEDMDIKEGDLLKLDNVHLRILDEESLRQFLILKRDALKGLRVEGVEINNLVLSMLQDYSYFLVGNVLKKQENHKILIKIPMESQAEFENKYKVDDILIGKVSIIGIYKGQIKEEVVTSNTYSFFKEKGNDECRIGKGRIIQSSADDGHDKGAEKAYGTYEYIDVLAIIQDVNFREFYHPVKQHWWNRFGLWLYGAHLKND